LLFTPLFTAGLGAVKPELYSHGSAIIGTVQQVAGAVGTALFVTVMSIQSAALTAGGSAGTAAVAGGVRAAFLAGAIISIFAVAAAFFVRKPVDHPSADNQAADSQTPEPSASASAAEDR
jgi:DHA2 family lincomycin resistance protein-like MFS transporter